MTLKKLEKFASGSNFGALGRVRGGPGRPKGVPAAFFCQPKNLGKSGLRALCDALGCPWALGVLRSDFLQIHTLYV